MKSIQTAIRITILVAAWLFLMLLVIAPHSFAQANGAGSFCSGKCQFFDNSGFVLASGWVCTAATGTNTPQSTYTDATAGTPVTSPINLDSAGRSSIFLAAGLTYRMTLYAAGTGNTCNGTTVGSQLWQLDGIATVAGPTYGFITATGAVIQLGTNQKVAWGASGGAPYVQGNSDNYFHIRSGTNGTKIEDNGGLLLGTWTVGSGRGQLRIGPSTGPVLGAGTPTIGTCGTGSITSNSTDFAGEATATGATSCIVTFSTPFAGAPFCTANDETTVAALKIVSTTSQITVSNLTAADKFAWICIGR